MLHCGLHAINAILAPLRKTLYSSEELDDMTVRVHHDECSICTDGTDTVPQVEGNYPLETLLRALHAHHLMVQFEKPQHLVKGRTVLVPRNVVGFLIGTGTHYLARVRKHKSPDGTRWQLVHNGVVVKDTGGAPFTVIQDLQPRAVLRVMVPPVP